MTMMEETLIDKIHKRQAYWEVRASTLSVTKTSETNGTTSIEQQHETNPATATATAATEGTRSRSSWSKEKKDDDYDDVEEEDYLSSMSNEELLQKLREHDALVKKLQYMEDLVRTLSRGKEILAKNQQQQQQQPPSPQKAAAAAAFSATTPPQDNTTASKRRIARASMVSPTGDINTTMLVEPPPPIATSSTKITKTTETSSGKRNEVDDRRTRWNGMVGEADDDDDDTSEAENNQKNNTSKTANPSVDLQKTQIFVLVWFLWLLTGTCWYSFGKGGFGLSKGLYMAVNIGYSIGFGYPVEVYENYLWFSSAYVVMGASFVAIALGFFAEKIGQDYDSWFTQQEERRAYEESFTQGKGVWKKLKCWYTEYSESVRPVVLWLVWIGAMIAYSMVEVGWSFTQAQYFAISTCSTGGHWVIPQDSPDWMYATTGVFAALGVPIMGIAMATIGRALVNFGDLESTKATILEDFTAEELDMMTSLGLEDGDFKIDKAEFIILCMIRTGTEPELVRFISDQFERLDDDKSGFLQAGELGVNETRWKNLSVKNMNVDIDSV